MKSNDHLKVEEVLGRKISEEDYEILYPDWRCFCENAEHYRGTIVVQMVNQYMDGVEETE
jgi:hypothetical protein